MLVVSGKSSREIAETLSLSPRTVQTHIAAIFNKLGVRSRVELTATLLRPGHARIGFEAARGKDADGKLSSAAQVDLPPSNLPYTITKLFGRDDMLADLVEQLLDQRLVTLVGPGGVGKTRAALEAGSAVRTRFRDGVFIVDMSVLGEVSLVPGAVATVLGVSGSQHRPVEEAIAAWLRPRSVLLIFDSCERVVGAVAQLAEFLLRACPDARILATSQATLDAAGEYVYEVAPLQCPEAGRTPSAAASLRYGAVALFVERARAAARHFRLDDENVRIVSEICRRVDGIPLGIELVASSVRVLGLDALARLLEQRLPFLDGKRGLPERHQTMRALFEWSDGLLDDAERAVLRRVAVFVGGWTADAAEVVCVDSSLEQGKVFGLLSRLVRKSQVFAEHGPLGTRYRLLDSVREFALEALEASGERAATALRHAQWTAGFAEETAESGWTTPRRDWLATVGPEVNNMRAALAWAFGPRGEPVLGMRIAASSAAYWHDYGLTLEGRAWIARAFEHVDDMRDEELAGKLWATLSSLLGGSPRVEAAKRAIEIFDRSGQRRRLASSFHTLAAGHYQLAQFAETEAAAERALHLFRETNTERSFFFASALGYRALALTALRRYDEARKLFDEDIALLEALGDRDRAAVESLNRAELECAVGDVQRALEIVEYVFDVLRSSAQSANRFDDLFLATAAVNATAYQLVLGQIARARSTASEAITRARSAQYPIYTGVAIQHAATIAALTEHHNTGALLRGFVDEFYRSQGVEREPTEQRLYDVLTTALEEHLSDEELNRLTTGGALLSEEEAVQLARSVLA
jgi:predicted ATPase